MPVSHCHRTSRRCHSQSETLSFEWSWQMTYDILNCWGTLLKQEHQSGYINCSYYMSNLTGYSCSYQILLVFRLFYRGDHTQTGVPMSSINNEHRRGFSAAYHQGVKTTCPSQAVRLHIIPFRCVFRNDATVLDLIKNVINSCYIKPSFPFIVGFSKF